MADLIIEKGELEGKGEILIFGHLSVEVVTEAEISFDLEDIPADEPEQD